jgi:hypothetical protein
VASSPTITDIPRIGVNLGTWTYYGAEQYRQNVLMNPGFEPTYEGRILEVTNPTGSTFEDDVNWIGEGPANWYNGATFSVRSGVSTGATGQISGYNPNSGGDPIFTCKGGCPTLNTGDEISMYYTDPPSAGAIASWWTSDTNLIQTNSDHEPNSQGTYSLKATLNGSGHRLDSYLDSYGSIKTINYLPVTGTWTISFWAKAVNASSDASVSVNLIRLGDGTHDNTNFISQQNFTPTGTWQQFSYSFTGNETANLGTLDFSVVLSGSSGTILLDDMTLGPASGGAGGWRNELVSTLSALHPGVIRDTQGQLGEPFSQRTGGDTAHGPSSYNGPTAFPNFTYTMADFFALAHAVGAEPWVVIPDTVTDAEIQQYGQFLEQQQSLYHFPEIMIELGNENWNGLFRGAGIVSAASYGLVAERDFTLLQEAASNDPTVKMVGGGQYGNPDQVQQVAENIPSAPYIAAAPYFWGCQDTGQSTSTYLTEMFNDGWSNPANEMIPIAEGLKPGQTAVTYEENLTTTGGSATTAERMPIQAGYASGGALEQQILRVMNSGFRMQNVFAFEQLQINGQDGVYGFTGQCDANPPSGTNVPLWGIVHDLNASSNLIRPTGLAVELANLAIAGNFYPVNTSMYSNVTGAAFLASGKWSALFSNGTGSSQTIIVTFPSSGTIPATMRQLSYTSGPTDLNESSPLVTIGTGSVTSLGNNQVSITLPAWGAVALTP